jgi:mRNA interferase RelE/StbE
LKSRITPNCPDPARMKVSEQIRDYVRQLHPAQRRAIKAALRTLESGRKTDVRALSDELEGYYRLRIDKFRILFNYLPSGQILCEYINARDTVYERFTSLREMLERR